MTLDQLAHFNRCLFPETLINGLVEHGVDRNEAMMICSGATPALNVLDLYQEYISDSRITNALDMMVKEFIYEHYVRELMGE